MKYIFTYLLLLFSNSYSLVTPPPPVDNTNICLAAKKILFASKSTFVLNQIHNDVNKFLIKEVTGWLPAADIVSKKVLEWNDIYITRIIDSRIIPEDLKKTLILDLINIVQWGDSTGSDLINWYYNFVNCLLP
jgi:hypothetical protein